MNLKIQVCDTGDVVQCQNACLPRGRHWVWSLSLQKRRREMKKDEERMGARELRLSDNPNSSKRYVAILQRSYLSGYTCSPFPWSCFSLHLTRTHFPSVSPAAATRTLTDILLWSGRHSAATSAVSMLRGSWSTTWTLFSSSKRSWSWGGSLRAAPSPSGWIRCWWVWAAPACPPSSATWPKSRPETDSN